MNGASTSPGNDSLAALFGAWASRVRARLALRRAITGGAIGLAVAVLVAAVAWKVRLGEMRAQAAWLGAAGVVIGLVIARRRRWSDVEVALFLDARLASNEVIATAIEANASSSRGDAARATTKRAIATLTSGDRRRARTRLFLPVHAILPVAAIALVTIARLPLPAIPTHANAPGAARVTLAQAEGLERIAKLAQLSPRDDAQRERLAAIARDAAALRAKLQAGMDRRDAQDQTARLREAIDAERLSMGDGPKRAGLESAVARLSQTSATRSAARALGDHDMLAMDAEMARIANARERNDRALADSALADAAKAAKRAGANDVAAALEAERRLLAQRAEEADTLRALADALAQAGASSDDAERALDSLDRTGSKESAQALAKALADAWSKLTPEERARIAAKMAKRKAHAASQSSPVSGESAPPPDAQQIEDALRAMADGNGDDTDEANREAALDAARSGAGETEATLGGSPGGAGEGQSPGKSAGGPPSNGAANGDGTGAGGSHDFGTGSHAGSTARLGGDTLKSRAQAHMNAAAGMPSAATTFVPGQAGDVATALSTGDLRSVGGVQMDGVDKSDVPQEYRDHVRQYFNPRETPRETPKETTEIPR